MEAALIRLPTFNWQSSVGEKVQTVMNKFPVDHPIVLRYLTLPEYHHQAHTNAVCFRLPLLENEYHGYRIKLKYVVSNSTLILSYTQ